MKTYKITLQREVLQDEAPEIPMTNSVNTARYLRDHVFDAAEGYRESCHMLFLDKKLRIIGRYNLSVGGTDCTTTDVKLACKVAIEALAHGVILSHNHPSGDPTPGVNDIHITEKMKKALAIFDISLVDHIVLGDDRFYSFADETEKTFSTTKAA